MKWNWGTKIVLAFILFCGFILYMVAEAFREDFDLVSENYYQDELNYQQKIEQKSNLAELGLKVAIDQDNDSVLLKFPSEMYEAQGSIYFYHPSRKIFDKTYVIRPEGNNQQVIPKSDLLPGRYKVKLTWDHDGSSYFQETEFFVQ